VIPRIRDGRFVASILVMVALVLPLGIPAAAHSASYCGHFSTQHFHSGSEYNHVFVQHWGSTPHEHEKDHYLNDLGQWIYLHTRTKAC
jgi:hypothetical protein